MDIFAERLREERKLKGYSQSEMAKKLGISQGGYKGYELAGEKYGREPSLAMIRKICAVLEISSDYLLGLKDL